MIISNWIVPNWIESYELRIFVDQAVNIFFKSHFSNWIPFFSKLDYTKMDFPKLDSGSELMSFLDQTVNMFCCKPFSNWIFIFSKWILKKLKKKCILNFVFSNCEVSFFANVFMICVYAFLCTGTKFVAMDEMFVCDHTHTSN